MWRDVSRPYSGVAMDFPLDRYSNVPVAMYVLKTLDEFNN